MARMKLHPVLRSLLLILALILWTVEALRLLPTILFIDFHLTFDPVERLQERLGLIERPELSQMLLICLILATAWHGTAFRRHEAITVNTTRAAEAAFLMQ